MTEADPSVSRPPSGPPAALDRAVFLWFFLSGASALIYEVVWLRWLIHLFGATTLAISTVLAAFMGGLAVGSWLAGRWASRLERPLVAYGLLELAIGGYALALPLLLGAVVPVLRTLGATEASPYGPLSLARFGLAMTLLVLPTASMGATLPILAQFAVPRRATLGGRVGRLYAVNTAGAVVGTGVAGFVLLPTLGALGTNVTAAALNLAVGLTAVVVGRAAGATAARRTAAAPEPVAASPQPEADMSAPASRRIAILALATATLSGGISMIYEVGWTRALSLVLGSSVYAFTVMLTTFLIGIAAGSYLAARRVDRLAEPGLTLGLIQLLSGMAAFLGLVVLDELPYLFLRLFALSDGQHALLLPLEFVITGALILLPALCSGAVFPLCLRLTGVGAGGTGRSVGTLYAFNTWGAILGSVAGGFILIPAAGIRGTLLLGILLNLAWAFALLLALPTRHRRFAALLAAGLPVLALAAPVLAPDWKPLTMASGVAVAAPGLQRLSRQEFHERRARPRLLFYEEGLTTTVSVEQHAGRISLRVNGKTDASTGGDMPNQVLSGHLPLLFHRKPEDVLVIGLGSGVTVGSVLRHPVRTVTVVELEQAVITASRFFDPVSFRPLEDSRTRLVVNDGRNFLLFTRDRYDVIASEPSNPWMTGAASLFTRDFFELARARLRPGGVFGQWIQLYGLSPEILRTVVATFASVFPHAVVFQTTVGDTALVGSTAPLSLPFQELERRLAEPRVAADLDRIGIRDAPDLLARLVLDVEDVPRFVRDAPLNTDDNALVEFTAPRTLYVPAMADNAQRLADAFRGGGGVVEGLAREAPDGFLRRLGEHYLERARPQQAEALARVGSARGPNADLLDLAARAAAARGASEEAERRWRAALDVDPTHPDALLGLADHLAAHGRVGEARDYTRRALRRGGPRAVLHDGELLARLGAYREADAHLASLPRDGPRVTLALGRVRLALGDAAVAERLLRETLQQGDDAAARAALAAALDQLGRPVEARRERERALRLERVEALRLRAGGRVRARVGHLSWAAYELGRAAALMPWDLAVRREQARLLERSGQRRAAIQVWEEIYRDFPEHAIALLEVATLWEAESDLGRAREVLARYIAAERDPALRDKAATAFHALRPPPRRESDRRTP